MPPRYTDEQLLTALAGCAARLGRSPTMREFAADADVPMHPRTVVLRFGSWTHAQREAGLVPRRYTTGDELLVQLRALGDELGRTPTGPDLDARRASLPSRSLYWQAFGSLSNALRAAGFDVPTRAERTERALADGERIAVALGRLPRLADWKQERERDPRLLSEWQVYRLFADGWTGFGSALRERLAATGRRVG